MMFGKIAPSVVALLAMGSFASAADLPLRSPPPPPAPAMMYSPQPIANWTGFYMGEAVGAAFTNDSLRGVINPGGAPVFSGKISDSGIVLGPYLGYNAQLSNNFLIGAEADLDSGWILGRTTTFFNPAGAQLAGGQLTQWIKSQASLRARAGYVSGNTLIYATGGFALANVANKYNSTIAPTNFDALKSWRTGWTVGGGLEYALPGNWVARAEYRYSQFNGPNDIPVAAGAFIGTKVRHSINESAVKVGLGYHFTSFAGPVVASY